MRGEQYTVRLRDVPDDITDSFPEDEVEVEADSPHHAVSIAHGMPSRKDVVFDVDTPTKKTVRVTDGDMMLYVANKIDKGCDPLGYVHTFHDLTSRSDTVSERIAEAVCKEYKEAWIEFGDLYHIPGSGETFESKRALGERLYQLRNSESYHDVEALLTVYITVELSSNKKASEVGEYNTDNSTQLWLAIEDADDMTQRTKNTIGWFDDVKNAEVVGQSASTACLKATVYEDTVLWVSSGRDTATDFLDEIVTDEIGGTNNNASVDKIIIEELTTERIATLE